MPLPNTGKVKMSNTEELIIDQENKHAPLNKIPCALQIKIETKNTIAPK